MNIQLERVPCPRCGSDRSHVVAEGRDELYDVPGRFFASSCDDCGLWFQNPRPSSADLAGLYPDDYLPHEATKASMRLHDAPPPLRSWLRGVQLVPRFVPGGTLLELGCGNGARLRLLRELGWQNLHGVELVRSAASLAREDGFEIVCGRVEDSLADARTASFDTVIASMLLEHLADPWETFRSVARVLKPGGEFLFSTIVRDSLDARLYGPYWAGFDFPRHLVYFTTRDLAMALEDDFRGLTSFRQIAPIDFVRSSSWRIRGGRGSFADRLVVALGNSKPAKILSLPLALAGLTSRVSFRCYRKEAHGRIAGLDDER